MTTIIFYIWVHLAADQYRRYSEKPFDSAEACLAAIDSYVSDEPANVGQLICVAEPQVTL